MCVCMHSFGCWVCECKQNHLCFRIHVREQVRGVEPSVPHRVVPCLCTLTTKSIVNLNPDLEMLLAMLRLRVNVKKCIDLRTDTL